MLNNHTDDTNWPVYNAGQRCGPGLTVKVQEELSNTMLHSIQEDLIWTPTPQMNTEQWEQKP